MGNYASKDGADEMHGIPTKPGVESSHRYGQSYQDTVRPQQPRISQGAPPPTLVNQSTAVAPRSDDPAIADEEMIPTVFRWEHGGRNVYITGTFNNWEKNIPMHRSGNDFTYIHNLKRGKHAYRFVVDEELRFAPDQPTFADIEGHVNNYIDVAEFQPYTGDDMFFDKSRERKIPDSEFKQIIPDVDEYTKEPPALPPHLRHIILNKPATTTDSLALPTPQPVSLHHLYCTAIKDGMMVLGVTERYKHKLIVKEETRTILDHPAIACAAEWQALVTKTC